MIGTLPMNNLAPLDYRYALDAAMSVFGRADMPYVRCDVPDLVDEVYQRIPATAEPDDPSAALWVEPLVEDWDVVVTTFGDNLYHGMPLVVIASRPLARLLPERQSWQGRPLGFHLTGMTQLRNGLRQAGFTIEQEYGVHTVQAVGINVLSRQIARWWPDLGDRLHFAARLRYCTPGSLKALSTVALLFTRRVDE